jgi:hypothetical protein
MSAGKLMVSGKLPSQGKMQRTGLVIQITEMWEEFRNHRQPIHGEDNINDNH